MNVFGEFLYTLRKEKGMTQAELANALGVTNKAVSKWETGEAMPETSQLLPISKIFGVTVDELLNGKRFGQAQKEPAAEENKQTVSEIIDGHLFTRGKDDGETPLDRICGAVCAAVALAGVLVYTCLGALAGLWGYWVILPVCGLGCGIVGIIFNLCDRTKRRRKIADGKNPYTDAACGIIMLVSVMIYLCIGALTNLWHPYWVIVMAAGAVCGITGAVGNAITYKRNK